MDKEIYEEGDFLIIRDAQKAQMMISMSADIEEGVIVQVKQKHAGMLICEKEEPTERVEVKPFPPTFGSSFTIQPNKDIRQQLSEDKVSEEEDQSVVSDVSDFLSEDRSSKSDVLK